MEIYLGMKRSNIEKLRDELTKALENTEPGATVSVDMYGDVDEHGVLLHVNNDDMERDEVPADAIYAEVEE